MYIFFVAGYHMYNKNIPIYINNCKWKALIIYIVLLLIFDKTAYDIKPFILKFYKYGIVKTLVIDSFKIILGIIGSYLIILGVKILSQFVKGTFLEKRALKQGRQTKEIYLLNIIIIEMLFGPFYRNILANYYGNFLHQNGVLFELFSTFLITYLFMEFIVLLIDIFSKSHYFSKILFYR
jgi:hypothetical protein